jgi:hypothetical protein
VAGIGDYVRAPEAGAPCSAAGPARSAR